MSLCVNYAINGFELHQPAEGFELKDGTEYAPALNPRRVVVEVPGVHGQIPMFDDPISAITVVLTVRVHGADDDALRMRWNTLVSLLGMGTKQAVELTRHRDEHTDIAAAQLLSSTPPEFNAAGQWIQTVIVMNIPSGRWSPEDFIEDSLLIPGSDQESDIALASAMPVSDFLVRVQGPLSTITITDNISNTGISWGGATVIPVGEFLIVDMIAMRAWQRSDSQWVASGTDRSATLVFIGSGPLTLVSRTTLAGKESSVTVTASGTSGATELDLRGRPVTA